MQIVSPTIITKSASTRSLLVQVPSSDKGGDDANHLRLGQQKWIGSIKEVLKKSYIRHLEKPFKVTQ